MTKGYRVFNGKTYHLQKKVRTKRSANLAIKREKNWARARKYPIPLARKIRNKKGYSVFIHQYGRKKRG